MSVEDDIDEIADGIGGGGDGALVLKFVLGFVLICSLGFCAGGASERNRAEPEQEVKMCSVGGLTAIKKPCRNQERGANW